MHLRARTAGLIAVLGAAGCGSAARLPVSAGTGPSPEIPPPRTSLIPTVNIATPRGWAAGVTPTAVAGTRVAAFAAKLDHPRWLYVLPNGDVLVAETNGPVRPDDNKGIKGRIIQLLSKEGRRCRAERESNHVAPRRRR